MERVARVSEIIAASPVSFEEAIKAGFERANRTLRGITGLRVLEQRVSVEEGKIKEYRVRLEVIFVLETYSGVFSSYGKDKIQKGTLLGLRALCDGMPQRASRGKSKNKSIRISYCMHPGSGTMHRLCSLCGDVPRCGYYGV